MDDSKPFFMKIYIPPTAPDLVRVNIRKQGEKTEHITLQDTTPQAFLAWATIFINNEKLSIFEGGYKTTIEARESNAGENGKAISISFRGLSPAQTKEVILKNL